MSTNDDSASRRGRRPEQNEPDWRAHNRQRPGERWDQPSSGNRDSGSPYSGRDSQSQNAAYSGFTRPSYSQPQQRQEQAPPPPQQSRPYEPQQAPQNYYQEPLPRQEPPRSYQEPSGPSYAPPSPVYPPEPQPLSYGDAGRDDLFSSSGHSGYDQNPYGSQGGYQPAGYDSVPPRAPLMQPAASREADYYNRQPQSPGEDYERGFGARIAPQENASPRFFLPDEQSQAGQQWAPQGYAPSAPQAPMDRGYAPAQAYQSGGYDAHGQHEHFGHDQFDPRYPGQEGWHGEEQPFHGDEIGGLPVPRALHTDELDEDFFGDEDDFEDDHAGGRKSGRKKLIAAALAAAVTAGGGAYLYKSMTGGGDRATPFIRADNRPSKETPGNPGGRQFPNGEKAIYERLTPDGQTQVASFTPPPAPASPTFASSAGAAPSGSNSLEDRIEEALRRAQHTGDAPAPAPAAATGRTGADQPTVVRSESYRPDGTRVDTRPVIQPQFSNVNAGQLPPPFGNAAPMQPVASPAPPAAPFRAMPASPPAQPQFATAMATAPRSAPVRQAPPPAEPAAAPAGSFYVSLKSAPDERAIQRDLPGLTDKYKSVLGDVQLTTKIADLGSKGVTYRAVAGPLGSRQEAMDLCQKIKGVGGDKACFVTN
jgi:SPOR domain